MTPAQSDAVLARVRDGQVVLDCGVLCSGSFIFHQREFALLYNDQRWRELAVAVTVARWRQDLTYFYLGAAAEGLHYYAAATRYYQWAGGLATGEDPSAKCASIQNLCAGLVFPRDVSARLRTVARARQAEAAGQMADARLAPAIGDAGTISSDALNNASLIPDAPQTLLAQYIAARLNGQYASGSREREAAFADQALEVLNPTVAVQTRGNEIARPREIQELRQKLSRQPFSRRLVLGMYVQLMDYDIRTQYFTIRYPEYYSGALSLGGAIFSGQSQRATGVRGYTAGGTACVWEPGPQYPRSDLGDGFFVLLTACIQHPPPGTRPTILGGRNNEIPPFVFLVPTHGSLWPHLRISAPRAEQLIGRIGPSRYVWSELVFDVIDTRVVSNGPFDPQTVYARSQPALMLNIQPRGLFFWDTSGPQPILFESVGEGRNFDALMNGRLTTPMIVETKTPVSSAISAPPVQLAPVVQQEHPVAAGDTDSQAGGWVLPPPARPQ